MARGRQTVTLSADQINRLERFMRLGDKDHRSGYTFEQLKLAIGGPFKLRTLLRAMAGKPIWSQSYTWLAGWIDRYLTPTRRSAPPIDAKRRAAGDKDDEEEVPTGADRTVRGSR